MPIRDKSGKIRYTRQERNGQIMEMLFKFHLTAWRPSSHQVAIGLGLRPSHHVRGMLTDLEHCGLIGQAEQILANGRTVHRWFIEIEAIGSDFPKWKDYLVEKFGAWPAPLL